ncbi:EamA family transporter [Acinetobacter sp. MD2(2019)]|uniref:EamA family transporter n=1 Tax=Acinetobacter sp. MD2(2019) TaxID=2605273 RepID=UPI002D1F3FA5|nr:EamA family transporter [Acinetobacter sp. MD2(2019)]MEB3753263.1 EamA family transporter [Acinetobacter sp. MD2(2019)]
MLNKNTTIQSLCLLLLAMICVQSSASLAKSLFAVFPVLSVAALRLFLGFSLLAIFFKIWTVDFRAIRWKTICSYGAALAGMNAIFYLSLQRLPLGIAVSFEFVGPLSVALFHAKTRFDFIWVLLAIFGLVLMFPFHDVNASLDLFGVALALLAGACWAIYILSGQKSSGISGQHTVCLGMFVGSCILMPIALGTGMPAQVLSVPYVFYFIGLALLASALPFSFEMVALKHLTPLSFGTLMSLEPVMAALSGILFLSEHLLWTQWLALLMIILASLGCTYTTHQAKQRIERQLNAEKKAS